MFEGADVVYLCAAMTRFIDCEAVSDAYRVNVDGVVELAKKLKFSGSKIVYLSSEAVERALHTNYGMHKALAELGLSAVGNPVIARLSKVDPWSINHVCAFLIGLATAKPGLYRWSATQAFQKDSACHKNVHGCRLVSDGLVCQKSCEWRDRTLQ